MRKFCLLFWAFLPFFSLNSQTEKSITPLPAEAQSAKAGSSSSAKATAVTHAVVIGISDYQDPGIPDLRFADRDAEAFANFLRSPAGGSLDNDHLQILTNQNATAGRIAEAMDWLLEQTKEGDQAIIYFSGHGDVERKTVSQPGFLLCWDSPARVYMGGGTYSLAFLQEIVSTLSVQNKAKVVVVTDACHAGKLAGSQIGGAQLTAANLAKQYANELKILSCQPGEFSLEGEQWGGGRGIFSYHLVDGLFGLADRNGDGTVSLGEIDRYLEDHVTAEAAPQSQVPMLLGNKTERLASVNGQLLAELKKNKAGGMPMFMASEGRGFEDEILARVDSSIREMYWAFKLAVKEKRFLEPAGNCAEDYYVQLVQIEALTPLYGFMKRNYAAALQDDAQQVLNNLMNMEATELRLYRLERLKKYSPYPRMLARAAELLGERHYMYPTFQARKCYFEGQVLQMESPLNPDSLLGRRILDRYRESLKWQPDVALTYYDMSTVFKEIVPQPDSMIGYAQKAIERAPAWIRAYTVTACWLIFRNRRYDDAKRLIDQALAVDSSSAYAWGSLGVLENYANGDWKAAEQYFLKSISLDSTYSWAYAQLGQLYFNQNQTNKAKQALLKAAQVDQPLPEVIAFLGALHFNVGQVAEAEPYYNRALEIEPARALSMIQMAGVQFGMGRPEKADSLLQRAMTQDSSYWNYICIGEIYTEHGQYAKAELIFKRAISRDSSHYGAWSFLGWLYVNSGRYQDAIPVSQRAIGLFPHDLFTWRDLGQAYQHTGKKEQARATYMEILNINPESPFGFIGLASLAAEEGKTVEALGFAEQAIQNGCTYEELKSSELSGLAGFGELMKKYFPEQVKD